MLSSDFHDKNLTSISTNNEVLVLGFSALEWDTRIILGGLEKLRVSDFKEGNIISSVRVIDSENFLLNKDHCEKLVRYAYDIDGSGLINNEKLSLFLKRKIEEVRDGYLIVLEVEPSFGAYVVAVAKSISED
ncbi:hypothetical protein CFN58_06865 [Pseudomonas avellanae]|nr:hypothetical protein [Pseudomonas syringae]NYS40872.1 hypothetical protein [Pseudomonas syringae pv. actinidiae]OZI87011.1 hypothetical protein CFN58_06865 [Pseudomonas avellanae]PIN58067.1 hypothetical protein CUB86_29785 [Pseudomonas syringae pv. actinidiae]GAO92195.1 hypothetical protein PSA5_05780 [Pseudomonas syringae pv. actinidiae]